MGISGICMTIQAYFISQFRRVHLASDRSGIFHFSFQTSISGSWPTVQAYFISHFRGEHLATDHSGVFHFSFQTNTSGSRPSSHISFLISDEYIWYLTIQAYFIFQFRRVHLASDHSDVFHFSFQTNTPGIWPFRRISFLISDEYTWHLTIQAYFISHFRGVHLTSDHSGVFHFSIQTSTSDHSGVFHFSFQTSTSGIWPFRRISFLISDEYIWQLTVQAYFISHFRRVHLVWPFRRISFLISDEYTWQPTIQAYFISHFRRVHLAADHSGVFHFSFQTNTPGIWPFRCISFLISDEYTWHPTIQVYFISQFRRGHLVADHSCVFHFSFQTSTFDNWPFRRISFLISGEYIWQPTIQAYFISHFRRIYLASDHSGVFHFSFQTNTPDIWPFRCISFLSSDEDIW